MFFARPEVDQFDVDGAIGQDDVVETLHVTANEAFGKKNGRTEAFWREGGGARTCRSKLRERPEEPSAGLVAR